MVWDLTSYLILVIYAITVLTTIFMMMLENRSPVKTIAWMIVLLLFPVVGLIFYILVGRNFRKKLVISRRSLKSDVASDNDSDSEFIKSERFPAEYRGLAFMALNSSGSSVYDGNKISVYTDGVSLYDEMFKVMEGAQKYLHVEYYVFNTDEIGNRFMDCLVRKATQGVKVRLIVDDVGSWMLKRSSIKRLKAAGVEIYCYLKVGLPFMGSKVNYRNHRKIVVVDGVVGFTGGMNVADRYVKGTKWGCWRDTHIKVEGMAVHGLQRVFVSDWFFVSRELLDDAQLYFPLTPALGNSIVQVVQSGPDSEWESIMQMFFMSISSAKKSIFIETPYFLPNTQIITALQTAALGGVDVRIILPRRSDASFALRSSCSYIDEMLKSGVKVYFYDPGFIHSKTIVVDGVFSSVGTANMDFRSFDQNFEVNTLIYDPEFASVMESQFVSDLEKSTEIVFQVWDQRSKLRKFSESWARLFSPLM